MLVLIATKETQGTVDDDYSHTVEGELVTPVAAECCTPDSCGCGRGFPGLASARATTTAMVVDRPELSAVMLRSSVSDSLERGGWLEPDFPDDFAELVDEHVDAITRIGKAFGAGAIVRRNGSRYWTAATRDAA